MKKLLYIIMLFPILLIGQTQSENYVKTITYKSENSQNPVESITYIDGLGRPIQQISVGQSATGKNIVTPIEYDQYGRQVKEYLPYTTQTNDLNFVGSALNDVMTYYNTSYYQNTTNPFTQKEFDASPLNRLLKQASEGNDWAIDNGKEIKYDYQTNSANEVKLYTAYATWDDSQGMYTNVFSQFETNYYQENQLYKTITKDENWTVSSNTSIEEFVDTQGRVVLKRAYGVSVVNGVEINTTHDTYYVYDQFGNLTYVLPPLSEGNTNPNVINELCYQFKYDYRNRLVEKKSPGKQTEYIIYDKLDRVVATGPAYNPFGGVETGWMITKYDTFNRPVYTAWKAQEGINNLQRKNLQASYTGANQINEFKSNAQIESINTGYSNQVEPTTDLKILTINYYDNYDYPNALTSLLSTTIYDQVITSNVKGLETASWVRILDNPSSVVGELTHTFYDDKKYRPILTKTTNYLGGFTEIKNKYNFDGDVLLKLTTHKRTNTSFLISTLEEFEYTPQGRLLNHFHTVNNLSKELLSHNVYDELGKLITKKVGGDDVATFTGLQKVDYRYNIRGWLTDINDVKYLTVGSDPADLFGFRINYNFASQIVPSVKPMYDGSIAETLWSSGNDNSVRKYGYVYDDLNRLKDAIYQKDERPIVVTNSYDEHLKYDKNGNIKYLNRNGNLDEQNMYIAIDDLDYDYYPNTNKVREVRDNTNDPMGFKDSEVSGIDYTYDGNGNLLTDVNKGITNITYNHLNLPTQITFGSNGSISYIYNAFGEKILKSVYESLNGSIDNTEYLSGFQYKNSVLQFFPTDEGYVNSYYCSDCQLNEQYKFNYVYNFTDHLGNIRLSYSLDPNSGVLKIIEENNYYPFGLKHISYNNTLKTFKKDSEEFKIANTAPFFTPYYSYRYNSKEFQDELGLNLYDYGWRNYDPAIARWINSDPLLNDLEFAFDDSDVDEDDNDEVYQALVTKLETGGGIYNTNNLNPYGYGYNNPVSFDDPDGRCPWCIGAAMGALVDYGFQVAGNLAEGKDLGDALVEVDGKSILMSAASGAVGVGLAGKFTKIAPLAKKIDKANDVRKNVKKVEAIKKAEARAEKLSKTQRPGKDFTKAGKETVKDLNKAKNNGKNVCESCGTKTKPATQSKKGVKPSKKEAQVDHKYPKSKGGSGTPDNGQVLCRGCNLKKSNTVVNGQ